MTILQALDSYYGRMAQRGEVAARGFSREKISFAIVLREDGEPVDVHDLRQPSGRKLVPRLLEVPARPTRTSGIAPNLLWDKTSYALGRTSGRDHRTAKEHETFKEINLSFVDESDDSGLRAFKAFLQSWTPDRFDRLPYAQDMLGTGVVFALEGQRRYLHQSQEAARLLASNGETDSLPKKQCLVTGIVAPIARLHTVIKGVAGAQPSGAPLVSFDNPSFRSYAKDQGENAPTSAAVASRYAAALNRMLETGSRNRLKHRVGDATLVFWADTSETVSEAAASAAENTFHSILDPPSDETETKRVREALEFLAAGRPVEDLQLGLAPGTRFHVLGLSPNRGRISVRFWLSDPFDLFAARLAAHRNDLKVEPLPWRREPSISGLLVETLVPDRKGHNKASRAGPRKIDKPFDFLSKNHPFVAGELMRAVLSGGPYPRALLAAIILRLRAGDDPYVGWHAAAIRAVLARDFRLKLAKENPPMSLNREDPDLAYQMGRLFAALEIAQRKALGDINATIRDRYIAAASTAPAGIFPILVKGAQNHLGKLRKEQKSGWLERDIEEIHARIGRSYPQWLTLEAQGRFFIGYYHQRRAQYAGRPTGEIDEGETENNDDDE